jgi:hypothetical protein
MYDEILEACARDVLRDDLGLDGDDLEMSLAEMRDAGMFEVPEL